MIVESLHENFPQLNDLRTRSIRVDKIQHKVFVSVSFFDVAKLDDDTRKSITECVKKQIPKGYLGIVSFVDDKFTEVSFRRYIAELLKKRFPIYQINKEKTLVKIVEKSISVNFFVNSVDKLSMELSGFVEQITSIVSEYTCYNVEFSLTENKEDVVVVDFADQERLVSLAVNRELLKPSRYFHVENVEKCIGKLIDASPMYISDVRKPTESVVVCGKISDKTLKSSQNNPNMKICKFALSDDSGSKINCVMFCKLDIEDIDALRATHADKTDDELEKIRQRKSATNGKKLQRMMNLFDGLSVVVRGKVVFNDFSQNLEILVYDLCKCNILPISLQPTYLKEVPNEYVVVKPTKYEEFRQISFSSNDLVSDDFVGNNCVVLHYNGTGLDFTKDKLVSICAVKIQNGHVTEVFFTNINPEISVDAKLLSTCDVTVEKLVYCPTISEVIADLYKFVFGFNLVGNNLGSFLKFLNYYAAPVGFNFSNLTDGQTELISTLWDRSYFDKKPNCGSVAEVSKSLGITCASENFCKHSALAVAKAICVLGENSKI